MTLRQYLRQRQKRGLTAMAFAVLLAVPFGLCGQLLQAPWLNALPMLLMLGSEAYVVFGIRCPHCRGNLGLMRGPPLISLRRQPRVNFCACCGVSFDRHL